MPKIHRVLKDTEGKPAVGDRPTDLGVRVPADIQPNTVGVVAPGKGGMSVAPTPADLPTHRLPKRLQNLVSDARGIDTNIVWCLGEGDFIDGAVANDLRLRLDPNGTRHGFVEPALPVPLEQYRRALAATRDAWVVDETGKTQ